MKLGYDPQKALARLIARESATWGKVIRDRKATAA